MAEENTEIQEQQEEERSVLSDIQFEDIYPYGSDDGDTGLSARLKLKRNFEKIKAVLASVTIYSYSGLKKYFLSKVEDDEAQGNIGFLKGAWFGAKQWLIDAAGNANLYDVTVNGLLRAYNAMINKVKSSNYNGDGIMDTGWQIINDFEGRDSYAVFDRLYVRKKFTAEELEVRKWTGIGGNFVCSPSAGIVWQIDYYDADGNIMGYEDRTVPWTLFGRLLTLFTPHNANNRYLGRVKRVKRPLTAEEKTRVRVIRCYTYNDDGTTQTMTSDIGQNIIGAQMRCQTINKAALDYDGSAWTGKHFSNRYWWRLVQGYGSKQMSDGRVHDYLDFWVNLGSKEATDANEDTSSDWPEAGDTFVQMGHRTEKALQNIIVLETSTADAPAIKEYRGVNSWDLNGKRKTMISPGSGNELYASRFHIETEYEDVLVPADRGAWTAGMACAYYDRVSHGGSLWLCIAPDGTTLEPGDATLEQRSVWLKQVEKGDKGEASYKSTMFVRMNATPAKPADNKGSYTDPSPSGCLAGKNTGNQNVYWSDGIPSGSNQLWATTRIFSTDGASPQQSSWSTPRAMTDTSTYDVEFAKKQTGDAKPADPDDANRHGGSGQQVWFDPVLDASQDFTQMYWRAERECVNGVWGSWTVVRIKGEAGNNATTTAMKYCGPLASGATAPTVATYRNFTWTDNVPTQTEALPNVYVGIWEYEAGTALDISAKAPKSVTLFAHYGKTGADGKDGSDGTSVTITSKSVTYQASSSGTTTPTGTWSTSVPSVDQGKFLWTKTYVRYSDGNETISYAVAYRGTDGTSPIFADIDNEMDSVACTSDGKTVGTYSRRLSVSLWKGSSKQTLSAIGVSGKPSGVTVTTTPASGYVDISIPAGTAVAESARMAFTLSASGVTGQTVYFTLNGVRCGADGAVWRLVPTYNEVIRKKSEILPHDRILCRVIKIVGGNYTEPSSGYTLKVRLNGGSETDYNTSGYEPSAITSSLEFILYVDGTVADRETVPAVEDGTDGTSVTVVSQSVTYQVGSSGTAMPTGTWSTTVPSVPKGQFLWTKTYVKYSDGTETTAYAVSYNGSDGTNGTNGTDGKNGTSIVPVPNAIIITQQKTDDGAMPLSNISEYVYPVARDGAAILPVAELSITASEYCDAAVENDTTFGKHVRITGIWKLQTNDNGSYKTDGSGKYIRYTGSGESKNGDNWVWKYAPSGSVTFTASATTSGGQALSATISVPIACNLLGTYYVDITDDMKAEVARKVTAEISSEGVLTSTNFDNEYTNASWGVKQDITKTINELKGDGTYSRSTGFSNSRLSTAEQNLSALSNSLGQTNSRIDTAEGSIQAVSNNLTKNYSTTQQTASMINSVVAQAEKLNSYSLNDSSAWEQGSTDGEYTGRTYEQVKVDSSTRIRTRGLWPVTESTKVYVNSGYNVGVVFFDGSKNVTGSGGSGWAGWYGSGTTQLSVPTGAQYAALLVGQDSGITPDQASSAGVELITETIPTKSYIISTATSISQGVKTDIEGNLLDTGIDIDSQSITLHGNKVIFGDSSGNVSNIYYDTVNGYYAFNGKLYCDGDVELINGDIGIAANSSHTAALSGGTVRINASSDGSRMGYTYIGANQIVVDKEVNINNGGYNHFRATSTLTELGASALSTYIYGQNTEVKGNLAVDGRFSVDLDNNCIHGQGTKALPSNPAQGQIVFAKGTTGNLTVTGNIMSAGGGSIVSSVGPDRRSRIFLYFGSTWIEFHCYNN